MRLSFVTSKAVHSRGFETHEPMRPVKLIWDSLWKPRPGIFANCRPNREVAGDSWEDAWCSSLWNHCTELYRWIAILAKQKKTWCISFLAIWYQDASERQNTGVGSPPIKTWSKRLIKWWPAPTNWDRSISSWVCLEGTACEIKRYHRTKWPPWHCVGPSDYRVWPLFVVAIDR